MRTMAEHRGVAAMDLLGDLIERLTSTLGQLPLGRPGHYHELHGSYFDRIEAIEYSIGHDDGVKPADWANADVMLVGISRTGKTPLSIYLSVLGWKVANLPLSPGVEVPEQLFELDRRRVIGLTIDIDRLLGFRRERGRKMGISHSSPYADPASLDAELEMAKQVFRRGGFFVLNVTDRTVEANANAIIQRIGGRVSKHSAVEFGGI
jgi:regulator of PEP synthase PpsR (kinase-PPPase family)